MVNFSNYDEKRAIERATAEAFIKLHNQTFNEEYSIYEHTDAPDFKAINNKGHIMNLEICITSDREFDIQILLERTDQKDFENIKRKGFKNQKISINCLSTNVVERCIDLIKIKMKKHYGPNTALVIRDTSPLDWDWSSELEKIRTAISSISNHYEKGVWILSSSKDKLWRII